MRGKTRYTRLVGATLLLVATVSCAPADPGDPRTFILDARMIDGTGGPSREVDVRIDGDRIGAIGDLQPEGHDIVVDGGGLVLAPGFIDSHSHHDLGLLDEMPDARAAVNQGTTTIVVGQDGGQQYPLVDFFRRLEEAPGAINVASYAGHGTIRDMVMGDDYMRPSTDGEVVYEDGQTTGALPGMPIRRATAGGE